MSRTIEEIDRDLLIVNQLSLQADEIEELAEKHANSLRRKRAALIEELWDAKSQCQEGGPQ